MCESKHKIHSTSLAQRIRKRRSWRSVPLLFPIFSGHWSNMRCRMCEERGYYEYEGTVNTNIYFFCTFSRFFSSSRIYFRLDLSSTLEFGFSYSRLRCIRTTFLWCIDKLKLKENNFNLSTRQELQIKKEKDDRNIELSRRTADFHIQLFSMFILRFNFFPLVINGAKYKIIGKASNAPSR